jgi:hypothetical protein
VRISTFILVCCIASSSQAQVYRSLDPDGGVSFSDRPTANAVEVPVPVAPVRQDAETEDQNADPDRADPGPYDRFDIVAPENDTTSHHPEGNVRVSMVVSPPLMEGHRLSMKIDGVAAVGDLPNPAQAELRGLSVGTHNIQSVIVDAEGTEVAKTGTVYIHLLPPLPGSEQPIDEP